MINTAKFKKYAEYIIFNGNNHDEIEKFADVNICRHTNVMLDGHDNEIQIYEGDYIVSILNDVINVPVLILSKTEFDLYFETI